MATPVLIVGHGLAGSMLAWACEQAGIPSRVAAGIINPLTGRRWVPTWQLGGWRELAWSRYRAIGDAVGATVVREIRIHRRYRDPDDRVRFQARLGDPEVARWVERETAEGVWLRGGLQVETELLLAGLRARWRARGCLETASVDSAGPEQREGEVVIWCAGAEVAGVFPQVPWEQAKGEIITGTAEDLPPAELRNDGRWWLTGPGSKWRCGATYARGAFDLAPSVAARAELTAAAQRLSGRNLSVVTQEAGMRLTTPDRRPVVGWHSQRPREGILAGLASKGALWAPGLAELWVAHLTRGTPFPAEVDVHRFIAR
jgi:glycine oxidase